MRTGLARSCLLEAVYWVALDMEFYLRKNMGHAAKGVSEWLLCKPPNLIRFP
jgi:hypothetical protein